MRVISHSCSNTEIICALGCESFLVGVDDHSDYPEHIVTRLPRVGPDLKVDPEKVAALQPDLIIVSDTVPGHSEMIQSLQHQQLPVIVIAPRSLNDISDNIQTIADALGVSARGRVLATAFNQAIAETAVATSADKPKVLVEWWPKPVIVPGQYSWVTRLLELAGATNPWAEEPVESLPLTTNDVIQANPDIIVMSWCGVPAKNYRAEVIQRRQGWQTVTAIQRPAIYPIDECYLGRPGPRLIQGLERLKRLIAKQN